MHTYMSCFSSILYFFPIFIFNMYVRQNETTDKLYVSKTTGTETHRTLNMGKQRKSRLGTARYIWKRWLVGGEGGQVRVN